ncbi:MAG: alpha-1,2-fucosyltransferase [Lachnospiraceae bacterium]|nr:alpha-1,2-fucosyltransferase [Lachnospiraceae bacterium]
MFIVRFTSGLGNQMFQYAFCLLLKKLYPEVSVKADLTWFYANNDHHGYELYRIFGSGGQAMTSETGKAKEGGFCLEEASKNEIFRVTGLIPNVMATREMVSGNPNPGNHSRNAAKRFEGFRRYPNRILREFSGKKREPYIIDAFTESLTRERLEALDSSEDYYFIGFFTEEELFKPVLSEARRAFAFPAFEDEQNLSLKYEILSTNSVSIHVRRGDYVTTYRDMFKTLSREYYEKAIRMICEQTGLSGDSLRFFIFSDDPGFVEAEFGYIDNKKIVANNTGEQSFRDMQLMSLCRHNIIANSTFSQWAALLNENTGHLTIYPRAYLKDRDNEIKTISGWLMCDE